MIVTHVFYLGVERNLYIKALQRSRPGLVDLIIGALSLILALIYSAAAGG